MLKKALLLFANTFSISLTANSGYAMLGVIKNRFVDKYGWFTKEEMEDYIALAQSCPGPIACSSSMIIGYRAAGFLGAFFSVLGVLIPPFVMMVIVTYFYTFISTNTYVRYFIDGMQAGVCAMLTDVVLGLFDGVVRMKGVFYYVMVILSFLFVRFTKYSIFYLAIICIVVGIVKSLLVKRKADEQK
ncbi:MAG: chromate transporter [Erysipelotrichaceae bacterium]|nr:chromate transporter [Erysipelotrichaceae bacterium]MBR5754939.1 chromate transporter [Erysipelotrichaceae bacterium]